MWVESAMTTAMTVLGDALHHHHHHHHRKKKKKERRRRRRRMVMMMMMTVAAAAARGVGGYKVAAIRSRAALIITLIIT